MLNNLSHFFCFVLFFLSLFKTTRIFCHHRHSLIVARLHKHTNRIGESGEWDQLPQIHTNSSITSYQMTELMPFTIYSFRVLAVNSLGISPPSKESYYIVTLREGKSNDEFEFDERMKRKLLK